MSEKSGIYITTAIDYANGHPHIGHALEKVGADAMVRYQRLKGQKVRFVIGMDEHGQNVLQSARDADVTPQEWVERIGTEFRSAWSRLSIDYDDFIRTTEPRHHRAVGEMIRRIRASDDLYRGTYEGYYCVRCEAYKSEDDLERAEPAGDAAEEETEEPRLRCPLHPSRDIEWMEEENWFFRLSRYTDRLLQLLDEHPEFIQPDSRRNEIRRVLEDGLEDISVSRARLPWGVPWADDPEHTVYVWLDALTNYLAAVGFPDEEFERWWPADFHVIGKDITRFHCIYWPAFLMSAGLDLPRTVWAHGFVSYGGRRLSKSEGVSFDLDEAIERHGSEALRYFLLREVPWNGDGSITRERFDERYQAELADDLGNLVNRTLSMVERYRDGVVPDGDRTDLDDRLSELLLRYRAAMDEQLLHLGVQAALELTADANRFVEESAPWDQARDPERAADLDSTLASLLRTLAALSTLLSPFMPGKMASLAERIGLDAPPKLEEIATLDLGGRTVHRGEVLFPKVDARAPASGATGS